MKINIQKYRGDASSSFTGRTEGEEARAAADLDGKDRDSKNYEIDIPRGTTAFNPSFFLGFFYKSIKKLGMKKFENKYNITILETNPDIKRLLEIDISEGIRHAINQIDSSKGGGLQRFLNK